MRKTSLQMPASLAARHDEAKAATGYTDSQLHDYGVTPVLAEVTAARHRSPGPCLHVHRYPNRRCRHCYALTCAPYGDPRTWRGSGADRPCDHPTLYANGRCRTCREFPASADFSPGGAGE